MSKLTDRDREILGLAWQCFKTPVEIDYTKLRDVAGYKTTNSATACYFAAKKKLLNTNTNNNNNTIDIDSKPTARDREIIMYAWQCFKKTPPVDFNRLSQLGGFKNANSAGACYGAAKKKLFDGIAAAGKGKSSSGSAVQKASDTDMDMNVDVEMESDPEPEPETEPEKSKEKGKKQNTKSKKAIPRKRPAIKEENASDDEEGETTAHAAPIHENPAAPNTPTGEASSLVPENAELSDVKVVIEARKYLSDHDDL